MKFLKLCEIKNTGILMLTKAERNELDTLTKEIFDECEANTSLAKIKRCTELTNKRIDSMKSILN